MKKANPRRDDDNQGTGAGGGPKVGTAGDPRKVYLESKPKKSLTSLHTQDAPDASLEAASAPAESV